jgi:phage FluMu protein Com
MKQIRCKSCGRFFKHAGTRGPQPKECPDCRTSRHSKVKTIVYRAKYSWTKYSATQPKLETPKKEAWFCQICGKEIPSELPGYLFEAFPGEFIRLCSDCQNFATNNKQFGIEKLIKQVR